MFPVGNWNLSKVMMYISSSTIAKPEAPQHQKQTKY